MENLNIEVILTLLASFISVLMSWDSYKNENYKTKKINVKATVIFVSLLFIPISIFAFYIFGIKKSPATFEFLVILLKYFWIGACLIWIIDRYIFKNKLSHYLEEDRNP